MQELAKKPTIFNRKLFPLLRRYFGFSGSTWMMTSYILLSLCLPATLFLVPSILSPFFQLFILSNIILVNRYGIGEDCIVGLLPISKKQSVLTKCTHLVLTQIAIFAAMIAMVYWNPIVSDSGLYAKNKQLAVSVLLLSFAIVNLAILPFSFCTTKEANPLYVLLGALALFTPPLVLPFLLESKLSFFQNLIQNLALSDMILLACCVLFVVTTLLSCIYAVKNCGKKDYAPVTSSYTASTAVKARSTQDEVPQSTPDGLSLRIFLKILKAFGANKSVIKLIRKDLKMIRMDILLAVMALIYFLSYIPFLGAFVLFLYVTFCPTIYLFLFVPNGDLRFSRLVPIKNKDYILSKIILTTVIQSVIILGMYGIFFVLGLWGLTPAITDFSIKFAYFCMLFLAHAISNLMYFSFIFRYPTKKRAYYAGFISLFILMVIGMAIDIPLASHFQPLAVLICFVAYLIFTVLTWYCTKNARTEI